MVHFEMNSCRVLDLRLYIYSFPGTRKLTISCGGEPVPGHTSKGFRTAAFFSIVIVIQAGCGHWSVTPENAAADSHEVLRTLIGKQVTIRGKFSLRGKFGPFVLLSNQQVVYLVSI